MRVKLILLLCLIAGKFNKSLGQIPIGAWRTHFSYTQVQNMAITDNKIYAAAENGLFYFNTNDKSLHVLSKTEGLHDIGISSLGFNEQENLLIIGYKNGNLDVIKDQKIHNLPHIKEASISNGKKINHINFNSDTAYLATAFGIVTLLHDPADDNLFTIGESYMQLGEGGDQLGVNQSTIFKDSIFLATPEGIIAAPLDPDINKLDFQNWRRYKTGSGNVKAITMWENQLYAAINRHGIYKYNGKTWDLAYFAGDHGFTSLNTGKNDLLVATNDSLFQIKPTGNIVNLHIPEGTSPSSFKSDNNGDFWIGTRRHGLLSDFEGRLTPYFPNGPPTDSTEGLLATDNTITGFSGGYDINFNSTNDSSGFYIFNNKSWQIFNHLNENQSIPSVGFNDITDAAFSTLNNKTYLASYNNGILSLDDQNNLDWIPKNDILQNLNWNSGADTTLRITGLTINNNILWISNYNSNYPLISWNLESGAWQKYEFSQNNARFPTNLIVVDNNLWITLTTWANEQLLVFNPEENQVRYLSDTRNEGNLPGNFVQCMARDREGQLWTGTNNGVAIFASPFAVFNEQNINASRPVIENQYLLNGELITAIKVDGGNRKWVGTQNGVWLFNPSATQVIHHFTIDNSPLPANKINDIGIIPETGEVFIATPKGLVSFRSNATEPSPSHQNIKIFPNPVTTNFEGTVGIEGLPENVDIRITTISGTLIKKLPAHGGTASWNVSNHHGNRVGTGVYLIFSTTNNGEDTFIGKIAVIN